jgi:hypothetical protein
MYVNEDGKMHFYIFCLFRSSQNFREEISKPIIQLIKLGMRSLNLCHSMGLFYEKKMQFRLEILKNGGQKLKVTFSRSKTILYSW